MSHIKKILAPTDLSDLSLAGLRYAMELADSQGADLIVYHVADYRAAIPYPVGFDEASATRQVKVKSVEEFIEEHRKLLQRFLTANQIQLIQKHRIQLAVEVGAAHEKIVDKAAKEDVDMIVMSTHGRTGLLHMLIGSVTEQVVRHATCPVLSVRPPKEPKVATAV